jgi:hypothetical protein
VILEINKLINSDFDILNNIGWLLYNRADQNGGLAKEELNELLQIVTIEEMEKECKVAYDKGFNDAICE